MKKTTLSMLAGLMVINSAFAAPSVGDRKALCEKHPDKYVWVEYSQACVPVNPCKSKDNDIRSGYCAGVFLQTSDKIDQIVERYFANNSKSAVTSINKFDDHYLGVKTSWGEYLVIGYEKNNKDVDGSIQDAFWAYGYGALRENATVDHEDLCGDIADFASLLAGKLLKYEYDFNNSICYVYNADDGGPLKLNPALQNSTEDKIENNVYYQQGHTSKLAEGVIFRAN